MKFIRRLMAALTATVLAAGAIRVRGSGGTPPQHGGWQPLELPKPAKPLDASNPSDPAERR